MSVASWCCKSFCVVPCVSFCTGHFVMVPLNLTYLHCLQHFLFEHLFNLYFIISLANYESVMCFRKINRWLNTFFLICIMAGTQNADHIEHFWFYRCFVYYSQSRIFGRSTTALLFREDVGMRRLIGEADCQL